MEEYGPAGLEKRVRWLLGALIVLNAVVMIFLAGEVKPGDIFDLRFTAGIFLMLFVCIHGWYQYGWPTMVNFFIITAVTTWLIESIGIKTGIPFGAFSYADSLGIKIGDVPLMILPAYFFNGYLAWTMAILITGSQSNGSDRKSAMLVPFLAALLMVMWNMSFEPVMSTIERHWIWSSGLWYGVPITNYTGWFITSASFFWIFYLYLSKRAKNQNSWRVYALKPVHGYFFPVMYLVQGLPGLLHPFFRSGNTSIYRSVALTTALTMLPVALVTILVIHIRLRMAADLNSR